MKIRLRYWRQDSPGEACEASLTEFPASLGRDDSCSLTLHDSRVSRRHVAIELRDGELWWADMGSSNGFRLRGEKRREAPIVLRQQIQVGSLVIEVVEAPEREPVILPFPAASADSDSSEGGENTSEPILKGTQRRRRLNVVLPVVLTLSVVGYAIYHVVSDERESGDGSEVSIGTDAVDEELQSLRAEFDRGVANGQEVSISLYRRVQAFAKTSLIDSGVSGNGSAGDVATAQGARRIAVETLLIDVHRRRQSDFGQRLVSARSELSDQLLAGRAGEAVVRLAELQESQPELLVHERAAWSDLEAWLSEEVMERHGRFERDLKDLEGFGSPAELEELFATAEVDFRGSAYAPFVAEARRRVGNLASTTGLVNSGQDSSSGGPSFTSGDGDPGDGDPGGGDPRDGDPEDGDPTDPSVAFDPNRMDPSERVASRDPADRSRSDATEQPDDSRDGPLRQRLLSLLEARSQDVAVLSTALTAFDASTSADTLLELSAKHLENEALLEAGEIAYRWKLRAHGERLLQRYLAPKPRLRQPRVDELLAKLEGLSEVPVGGYAYSKKFGWESRVAIRSREVLADFDQWEKSLRATASIRAFRDKLELALAAVTDETLPSDVRVALRQRLLSRLEDARLIWAGELDKKFGRAFQQVRKAKIELNDRRAKAYAVIMDPEIYLPENHPDWGKGDVVNGQRQVDEVVDAVRELWESKQFDFQLGAKSRRKAGLFVEFERDVYPRLRATPTEIDLPIVSELHLNPNPSVTIQSFALDQREADLRTFNRGVAAYNAAFEHPDLPVPDLEHIVFVSAHREMMGVRRCFVDVRLCRATWKHSRECDKAGRIWHVGPDGSPQSRAAAEGFDLGVGENVALGYGNPRDIWTRGWYRASDHHRNAISPNWNCMGYGFYGRVGTQNFANAPAPFDE